MSGIAQAGLFFFVIFVLMFLSARDGRAGPQVHNEDEDSWWFARRSWWDERH